MSDDKLFEALEVNKSAEEILLEEDLREIDEELQNEQEARDDERLSYPWDEYEK